MNSNACVPIDMFEHKKARFTDEARERADNHCVQELQQIAEGLLQTPSGWSEKHQIQYLPSPEQLQEDLGKIPNFTKYADEQKNLADYIELVFGSYLNSKIEKQYQARQYVHIMNFIQNGNLYEIRIMMESTLLQYALGYFSRSTGPWEYLSKTHEKYRQNLAYFGVKAYHFYFEEFADANDGRLLKNIGLTASYFRLLGDSFRVLAWEHK